MIHPRMLPLAHASCTWRVTMVQSQQVHSMSLTHFDAQGQAHMVDVADKAHTKRIGVATGRTVERLLVERRHPEHGYRACLGLLSLSRKYGKPRLEAACLVALELGTAKYSHVRDILASKRDQMQPANTSDWTSPQHEHVRGPSYYQ